MDAKDAIIAWKPGTENVKIVRHPDRARSTAGWWTGGACFAEWQETDEQTRDMMIFLAFHSIVVRDQVPVAAAHKAFLAIDQYRKRIAPDIKGAE